MVKKLLVGIALSLAFTPMVARQQHNGDMKAFVDKLMAKMTLREKIGQLNLPVTGEIVTGAAKNSGTTEKIRSGEVGGLFNLKGVEKIK